MYVSNGTGCSLLMVTWHGTSIVWSQRILVEASQRKYTGFVTISYSIDGS